MKTKKHVLQQNKCFPLKKKQDPIDPINLKLPSDFYKKYTINKVFDLKDPADNMIQPCQENENFFYQAQLK